MKNDPATMENRRRRLRRLVAVAVVLAIVAAVFGRSMQSRILRYAVLNSETADETVLQELLQGSRDRPAFLERLWQTGKIPHRLFVVQYLRMAAFKQPELCVRLRPLLFQAALDPDMDAREQALAALAEMKDPGLAGLARLQLADVDPQIRLLGLRELRQNGDKRLVPALIPLLDDPEPIVVANAESLLRNWTGNDFGFRIHMALEGVTNAVELTLNPEKAAALHKVIEQWQSWWRVNGANYPKLPPISTDQVKASATLAFSDFSLPDLSGNRVRPSDFKGKAVLIHFWATWCTACLLETPGLVGLQRQHSNDVVIISISLDGRPERDEDGDGEKPRASDSQLIQINRKIGRLVKSLGINYPVLLNPDGDIGARFNGGELPTNLILTPDGRICRRFVGARSVHVLESMLREAAANRN